MGRWGPLAAICLGSFMLLVDVNIVTVAMPDMAGGLDASYGALQWVLDVYALVLAALLLGAGALADRLGRRRTYVAGLTVFAAASLACGLAPDATLLVTARAVQGAGAALMFATTVALVGSAYTGRDRGVAFGVWGAVNGAAAGIGPVLGGLVAQTAGWRWIFLVNLPVSVAAVVLTRRVVAESRGPARPLDVTGTLLFAFTAGTVVLALTEAGRDGWTSPAATGAFALGGAGLAAFLLVEARNEHPVLDLRLFRDPAFTGVMVASLAMSGAAFASLMFTSLWLRSVQGLGAIEAGLAILPMSGLSFAASWLTGRLPHDVPARWTVGGGMLLVAAGTLAQSTLSAGSSWAALVPGFALTGIGVGLALPNVTAAAMAAVPPERGGMAAGAVSAFRQLGYALGIAVLSGVFHPALDRALTGRVPDAAATAQALTSGHAPAHPAVPGAFATALNTTTLTASAIALAAAATALLLIRRTPSGTERAPEPAAALAE
ncbi:MFS transporter [Actinomadura kijaniata]|uniref:EmrB/QacA subfamily drug resistance transporter n=1 Tax=Actinomadura namibiensis TaxID=182080 RepID=A0A7W3LM28_ACTNM|nr:MFS transporter [Actinomadura namibiensis]MBA8950537.1 EmrB/QacA subfamily drug resistance transporter [Actinomadura namibiensis]